MNRVAGAVPEDEMISSVRSVAPTPIRALFIADDRPGHYNLSLGILAAIGRRRDVDVRRLNVARPYWLPARLLSALTNLHLDPARLLRIAYGLDRDAIGDADLIVSAGGNTLAANVAAARLLGVPNIFYGSLRRFKPADFSIAFTSYESQATHPHIVATLKPSRLDPARFPPPPAAGQPIVMGLLIGGDTDEMRFSGTDWQLLLALVADMHRQHGVTWIISNSRRTPASTSDAFLAASRHAGFEFIDVRTSGSGTLDRLFSLAAAVAVTADSSSMLSEAIWLRRPVVALQPAVARLAGPEARYREQLISAHLTRTLLISGANPATLLHAMSEIIPMQDDPAVQLGQIIAARIPGLFPSASASALNYPPR